MYFEFAVITFGTSQQLGMTIDSGYKFSFLKELLKINDHKDVQPLIKEIQEKMKQPLSLEKQAANVLRTRLQPNAFVGVQHLALPPGYNKSFITLGVCGEDACMQCTQDWHLLKLSFKPVSGLLKVLGGGVSVGPILLGCAKPVHVVTQSITVRGLVNMSALASGRAEALSHAAAGV